MSSILTTFVQQEYLFEKMVEEVLLKGLTGQRATVRAPLELITFGSLPCFILLFNSLSRTSPQVVLFGDSLTQRSWETPSGWASQLATLHCRKTDVFNRGYEAQYALGQICAAVYFLSPNAEEQPGNSGDHLVRRQRRGTPTEHAHVPVDEYEQNLRAIVAQRGAPLRGGDHSTARARPDTPAYQQRAYGDSGRATGVLKQYRNRRRLRRCGLESRTIRACSSPRRFWAHAH